MTPTEHSRISLRSWPKRSARGWDGDDTLANVLEYEPAASSKNLAPVGVDLDELADALAENAGSEGFLDLRDGQV